MRALLVASHCLLLGVASAAFASEPAATPVAPAAATDNSQEIICRKDKETGSLVKTKKTCHSRAQWAYIDDTNQQFGRQIVQDGTSRPAGN